MLNAKLGIKARVCLLTSVPFSITFNCALMFSFLVDAHIIFFTHGIIRKLHQKFV